MKGLWFTIDCRAAVLGEAESPPLGWMCDQGGQPGMWKNLSSPVLLH